MAARARRPAGMTDPEALAFCYAATIWPERPKAFARRGGPITPRWRIWRRGSCACSRVALRLDEDYFEPFIDAPISALRALNYPRQDDRAEARPDPRGRAYRLRQPDDPAAGARLAGLEILTPDGAWTPVPPQPGAFVDQHRRSDGALDQRPLGLDPAPRRQSGARRPAAMRAGNRWPSSISPIGTRKFARWRHASRRAKPPNTRPCVRGPI